MVAAQARGQRVELALREELRVVGLGDEAELEGDALVEGAFGDPELEAAGAFDRAAAGAETIVIAYTDGLTDAINFSGQRFGKKRLRDAILRALSAQPDLSAARLAEHIFWEIRQFAGLQRRTDDSTLIVVRVLPENATPPAPMGDEAAL